MYRLNTAENLIFTYSIKLMSDSDEIIIDNIGKENYLKCKINVNKVPNTLNMATIAVFNLNNNKIGKFQKHTTEVSKKINVQVELGTVNLGRRIIFKGTASEVKYEKKDLNYELIIEAYDGGYQVDNAILNLKITKESTYLDLKKELANRMGLGYTQNNVADLQKIGKDIFIDTKEAWREYQKLFSDKDIYIDNETINFVNNKDLLLEKLTKFTLIQELTINQFIDYPLPNGLFIVCKTELNPFTTINKLIKINLPIDEFYSKYNGIYRISGIEHDVEIGSMDSDYAPSTSYELARIFS